MTFYFLYKASRWDYKCRIVCCLPQLGNVAIKTKPHSSEKCLCMFCHSWNNCCAVPWIPALKSRTSPKSCTGFKWLPNTVMYIFIYSINPSIWLLFFVSVRISNTVISSHVLCYYHFALMCHHSRLLGSFWMCFSQLHVMFLLVDVWPNLKHMFKFVPLQLSS